MTTTTLSLPRPGRPPTRPAPASPRRTLLNIGLLLALLIGVGSWLWTGPATPASTASGGVPRSAAFEAATGVRISRVVVVGDGGLITVFYVVVDPEKATAFQADRAHTPLLSSEARKGGTQRSSIMRTGHLMRPGATYYLVYENTRGVIRPGEAITVTYRGHRLRHVPVL